MSADRINQGGAGIEVVELQSKEEEFEQSLRKCRREIMYICDRTGMAMEQAEQNFSDFETLKEIITQQLPQLEAATQDFADSRSSQLEVMKLDAKKSAVDLLVAMFDSLSHQLQNNNDVAGSLRLLGVINTSLVELSDFYTNDPWQEKFLAIKDQFFALADENNLSMPVPTKNFLS